MGMFAMRHSITLSTILMISTEEALEMLFFHIILIMPDAAEG